MSEATPQGHCFIVSAPSGSGKTTLIHQVLDQLPGIEFIVSYTTRPPRAGEQPGKDYHFIDATTFEEMHKDGAFMETATVHQHSYGTPSRDVTDKLGKGIDIILEIDVQGAQQIRQQLPEATLIFILPSSPEVLRRRLSNRRQDSPEEIDRRMRTAIEEIKQIKAYAYLVINDDLATAADQLQAIIVAKRCQLKYSEPLINLWQKALR